MTLLITIMKKNLSIFILGLLLLTSCERDDICIEPTTPKLIIRFYDANNPTNLKDVKLLSVWATGKDTLVNYNSLTTDSIAIPLAVNATFTEYHFKSNTIDGSIVNNMIDALTINYTTEDIFVSRSCGYKTIFNNTTVTANTNNWIQSINVLNPNINNEILAHVKIYH